MRPTYALIYTRIDRESDGYSINQLKELQLCRNFVYEKGYIFEDGTEFLDKCPLVGEYEEYKALDSILKYIDKYPDRNFALVSVDWFRLLYNYDIFTAFHEDLLMRGVHIELPENIVLYANK